MACSTCKDVILLDPDDSGFDYTTTVNRVAGVDGIVYPITSTLVPRPHRPRGGWRLRFQINGIVTDVDGNSGAEAVANVANLFKLNGIEISKLNLWFNANIQWLERAIDKHQRVKLEQLLELADAHAPLAASNHDKERHSVSEWGASAFQTLSLYLAGESYSYDKFLSLVSEFATWMNPAENRLMGSPDAYIKITLKLANLKNIPLYSQQEAREWLTETQKCMGFDTELNYWV